MSKYYSIYTEINLVDGELETEYKALEFEYLDVDNRNFLLRTSGYRGKTYNKVRISGESTDELYRVVSKILEGLDMIYIKITIKTFRGCNYIEIEDIDNLYSKLINKKTIRLLSEFDLEMQEIIKEKYTEQEI